MTFEEIRQVLGSMFAQNYPGNIIAYIFGSTTRRDEIDVELDEVFGGDIDLLFVVDPEVFANFQDQCYTHSIYFADGSPIYPMDYFWQYHSPKKLRLLAALEALEIRGSLREQFLEAFRNQFLDILILPFGWEKDKKILRVLNQRDPNFSRNMAKDAQELFWVKNS